MHNKEREITYIVNNPKALEKVLVDNGAIFKYDRTLDRDIYKNNGDFFIRYSTEVKNDNVNKFFTMKTDGDADAVSTVKENLEIEFPIDDTQEQGLKAVFQALGYSKTNSYSKERKAYTMHNCDLAIDVMDGKTYFEIEFEDDSDMNKIHKLVKEYLEEK